EEVGNGARHDDLARTGNGRDPRRDVHAESADVAALASLYLAGVHARTDLHAKSRRVATDGQRGVHGIAGPFELDEMTVTGLLDDSSAGTGRARRDDVVEEVERLAPFGVTERDDRYR